MAVGEVLDAGALQGCSGPAPGPSMGGPTGASSVGVNAFAQSLMQEKRMKIDRTGSAAWAGGIKDGIGSISTASGALNAYPYGFASRFEGKAGSNPEELIGAAHAACFTMALSLILGEAKLKAEKMNTTARVTLESVDDGFAITAVHLTLNAVVPGCTQDMFSALAAKAKAGCPVSKLLNASITLDATLAA